MQNNIYLGLGSNIGDRLSFLRKAISEISKNKDISIKRISSVYESEAWGVREQNSFLNLVIEVSSSLSPLNLFYFLKNIEIALGRKSRPKWTEREIDIDVIFYGDIIYSDNSLRIPHPELQNRNFVLLPMSELNENFIHPTLGVNIGMLLKNSPDKLVCKKTTFMIPF